MTNEMHYIYMFIGVMAMLGHAGCAKEMRAEVKLSQSLCIMFLWIIVVPYCAFLIFWRTANKEPNQ